MYGVTICYGAAPKIGSKLYCGYSRQRLGKMLYIILCIKGRDATT